MEQKLVDKLTQYIEGNEETRKMLLSLVTGSSDFSKKPNISDDDRIKAAYALNMCTVSVSQIIDYDDLNVLEQEYETILNNLNLEQIPKDEALLHILKQLLDTITYFRIETGEKEMIDREYQEKMRNAIWSSAPNFGMIVAGGNPITMAVSLASQIGIGYMNYRRNKSAYSLERDRKYWELQKTAIEQFNGLRRELFDTAWRLADAYGFPDGYRLTEKQITQYNKILMDEDEIRKYERLESVKADFEAYPPFWYFLGNSANYLAGSQGLDLSEETRQQYRRKAYEYFDKFHQLNRFNILREDALTASCNLEYVDMLLTEKEPNKQKIEELLDEATKSSKNSFDILELCAVAYLKIGLFDKAAEILRILVNEDYNRIINAQLLSSIYVSERKRPEYELLTNRVDSDYLYPMPQEGENPEQLQNEFGIKLKAVLKDKYRLVLEEYVDKYTIQWNKTTSLFEVGREYPDSFFLDTKTAKADRLSQARFIFSDPRKKENYLRWLKESDYELALLNILNGFVLSLFSSKSFSNYELRNRVEDEIRAQIVVNKKKINEFQDKILGDEFTIDTYNSIQKVTLKLMIDGAVKRVLQYVHQMTDKANINEIFYLESDLRSFCNANALKEPEIAISHADSETMFSESREPFGPELFGAKAVASKKNAEFIAQMTSMIREKLNSGNLQNDKTAVYFSDRPEFSGYFLSTTFEKYPDVQGHALMIMKDRTKRKFDLIFTTDGIVSVIKDKVERKTPYNEVKLKGNAILLVRNELMAPRAYESLSFDVNALYGLVRQLATKFIKTLDDKIEYIEETITPKLLYQWFKESPEAMRDDVVRVYAQPKPDIMEHLGYHFEMELDDQKDLLQFYYEEKTGNILGIRIVHYDNIDSNFQAYLIEHGGMITIK